jgi:hypothetical protein
MATEESSLRKNAGKLRIERKEDGGAKPPQQSCVAAFLERICSTKME